MKVTVLGPNLPATEHTFHVHKAGCSDIKKMKTYIEAPADTFDVEGRNELVEIIGGETDTTIAEFKFYACVKQLPEGDPRDAAPAEPVVKLGVDDRTDLLRGLAMSVKAFSVDHRNDKLREWDVIADHWTVEQMIAELAAAPTKIRTYGGARRHFDWLVRLPNDKPEWTGMHGNVCMAGYDMHPDA